MESDFVTDVLKRSLPYLVIALAAGEVLNIAHDVGWLSEGLRLIGIGLTGIAIAVFLVVDNWPESTQGE